MSADALPLASYKLRLHEGHVRAVPARDESGRPFAGPGVDLRGGEAAAIIRLATPFREWLHAREPGVVLRSLSVDLVSQRIVITLEPSEPVSRPRVVRIDPPASDILIRSTAALVTALGLAAREKLRRRSTPIAAVLLAETEVALPTRPPRPPRPPSNRGS